MYKSLIFLFSFFSSLAMASHNSQNTMPYEWQVDHGYYSIGTMEIREIDPTAEDLVQVYSMTNMDTPKMSTPKLGSDDLSQIVNIGKKVWKVIVDNKPVVNVELSRASAVPNGIQSWMEMENWRDPVARKYQVIYKNLYGIKVVNFEFMVTYAYNGQVDGRGRYLSEVGFVPSTVTVVWMYNFNVTSQVVRTVNVGTTDNPIAGIELNLNWVVKTPLKEDRRSNNFYIRGDGGYRVL